MNLIHPTNVISKRVRVSGHDSHVILLHVAVVNANMVWKPGKLHCVYDELRFYVEWPSLCTNTLLLWLSASEMLPKIQILHEQKDGTKTLAESPDHIWIDFDVANLIVKQGCYMTDNC